MADETYQGWTNRETWALMLHIGNDQGLYEEFRELVRNVSLEDDIPDTVRERAGVFFTRTGYVENFGGPWPDALADIAAEIGSLWRVDWDEIVDSLLED